MSAPAVSVIVTSFNYGRYVATALESVRAQTAGDFECLVIDDGSTDDSVATIESFLSDARFRLSRLDNGGVSRARNIGLAQARGRFVSFLDADDVWQPTKIERQLQKFATAPSLGVVFTRRTLIDRDGAPQQYTDTAPPQGDVVVPLFRQNFVCFSSAMITAEAAGRVGGFDERLGLAVDYEFWLRVAGRYPFGLVDESLVSYRIGHGNNISARQRERYHVALYVMRRFQELFAAPGRLPPAAIARAEAETFANLGVLSRGNSTAESAAWLLRAVTTVPAYTAAWSGLVATLTPLRLRRLVRKLRSKSGEWEDRLFSKANRPEAVL
jgi:glycosyltransferase involved in cell wall biosynthesis